MRVRHGVVLGSVLLASCGGRSSLGLRDEVESASGNGGRADAGASGVLGPSRGGSSTGGTGATGGETSAAMAGNPGRSGSPGQSAGGGGAGVSPVRSLPGSPWEVMSFDPVLSDSPGNFASVWSDGSDRVWFTEYGASQASLLHWEDGVFSSEISGCEAGIETIRGNAGSDLWFAGCKATLAHFTGTHWTSFAPLQSHWVWTNSPTDVWSCCQKGPNDSIASAFNWNGSSWNAVALPASEYDGGALWSGGPKDLWIADKDVLHWNGTAWDTLHNPYVDNWRDVWGDGTNVWAVGPQGVLARWNGSDFEQIPTNLVYPEGAELSGVWGRTPNDVWFVGGAGAILHWDGRKLGRESVALVDPRLFFFGVWGAGNVLWVVGAEATLIRRTLEPLP